MIVALLLAAATPAEAPVFDERALPVKLDLTIAQRRFIWRRIQPIDATEVELSCLVKSDGRPSFCSSTLPSTGAQPNIAAYLGNRLILAAAPVIIDPAKLPRTPPARDYKEMLAASAKALRVLVKVSLLPPSARIDSETVTLTPREEFSVPPLKVDYPLAAQRNGDEGSVVMRCVVEMDLSLDCAIPADAQGVVSHYLEQGAIAAMRRFQVGGTLKSGASAVGKRFQMSMNFRMAQ